ncbi:MAG: DUF2085 domain-containing protein [Anaerolineales bacterium]|jgi:uncharacterized membrane protein
MMEVVLYIRNECHLCDKAIEHLNLLKNQIPHDLKIIDVDSDPGLSRVYGEHIPILKVGSFQLNAPFDKKDITETLMAAQEISQEKPAERLSQSEKTRKHGNWTKADSFTFWFSNHYLAVFNLLVAIYIGLPFVAPILLKSGFETPANLIYRGYGLVCHQLSFRSIFIFGEQPFYPRSQAGLEELISFSEATGLGEGNSAREIFAARAYHGDEQVGYKVALCQRDLAIYAAILFFGLIYGLSGKRFKPLPWYIWIIFGILPIGLDGISQIVSQPPFNFFPYRESTPQLRIITGTLFGFTTAWFGYPLVEETMADTRQIISMKFKRTHPESEITSV